MMKHSKNILALTVMALALLASDQLQAQGVSANFSDGSVVFGTDSTVCDPAMEGAIRYNSVSKLHQFCDGVDWTGFVAFAPSVTLAMIPNSNLAMNVTGPGAPAYGGVESFQVKNFGATPSDSLTVVFSDPSDNFDIVSDGCTGLVLNQNDFCDITIQPKATANGAIQASLTIPHNNAPSALLRGTASGFSCAAGGNGGGGKYVTCGAYNLVATPGGCTDSNYPTCPGTADTVLKVFGSNGAFRDSTASAADGPQNSVNLMGYVGEEGPGSHPAAEYCMNMTYGGYDDWYLPGTDEISSMYAQRVAIGGWAGGALYITSRQLDASNIYRIDTVGTVSTNTKTTSYSVRCVRRETQALPVIQHDQTPDVFYLPPVMTTAANRVSSATAFITSVTQDVTASLSNDTSGGARIKINGGAEVTNGAVGHGDIVQLVMTSPAVAGNANTVDVTVGTYTTRWKVGTPNATGTRRVFVSNARDGNVGGSAGADSVCQTEASAAGLSGTWVAIFSDRNSFSQHAAQRLDFNWATLVNMNGQTVANGWNDLWDGSTVNPINYDEDGVVVSTSTLIFADTGYNGVPHLPAVYGQNCTNWTSGSSAIAHYSGYLGGTGLSWLMNNGQACNTLGRLYCFENTSGPADQTPVAFEFNPMTKQAAASATDVESPTVTVTGIDTAVNVTISGGGSPEYRVNGGAWTSAPGTLSANDTLAVRTDAPGSNGSRNKVTINVGTYTTYWYVGAGDTGLTRRIFLRSAVDVRGNTNPGGGDAVCAATATAAGLGSNWASFMSEVTVDGYMVNRINVNWGTLTNLGGEIIANSWEDLWDGSTVNPVRFNENYQAQSAWSRTGALTNGRLSGNHCLSWSTISSSFGSNGGNSGASSAFWNGGTYLDCSTSYQIYCIETGANAADTTPVAFNFNPMTKQAAASATDVESPTVTVTAIAAGTAVSVSGTGNPEYRVNGGAWTSAPGTIGHNDTLTIRADAPATVNQRNKVTVTVGTYITYWYVGAGNTGNTKRTFVTSGTYMGAIGGLGGADSICSAAANAAGLGTGWVSLLSDSGVDGYAVNRAPLDWGTLTNMNGDVVANGWDDLWDGSVAAPINRSQANAVLNTYAWTGSFNNGRYAGNACIDWTYNSTSATYYTRVGSSGSSGSWFDISGTVVCNTFRSLYCIEQ